MLVAHCPDPRAPESRTGWHCLAEGQRQAAQGRDCHPLTLFQFPAPGQAHRLGSVGSASWRVLASWRLGPCFWAWRPLGTQWLRHRKNREIVSRVVRGVSESSPVGRGAKYLRHRSTITPRAPVRYWRAVDTALSRRTPPCLDMPGLRSGGMGISSAFSLRMPGDISALDPYVSSIHQAFALAPTRQPRTKP